MAKTTEKRSLEDLKAKAQGALADPKLVEIVKTAPLNKDGKVNLSWVYKEAEKYVHAETKDLRKTKELAVATRWLAMLRRDYETEFNSLVLHEEPSSSRPLNKDEPESPFVLLENIMFDLPDLSKVVIKESGGCRSYSVSFRWTFGLGKFCLYERVEKFCIQLLEAFARTEAFSPKYEAVYGEPAYPALRDCLAKILEVKFGLKVKVCGNCKHFEPAHGYLDRRGHCVQPTGYNSKHYSIVEYPFETLENCKDWAPKEVSEKSDGTAFCERCKKNVKITPVLLETAPMGGGYIAAKGTCSECGGIAYLKLRDYGAKQ